MSKETENPNPLSQWVSLLNDKGLPLFGHTLAQILKTTQSDLSPISALTGIILHDPAMTSHVLKLANSAYYSNTEGGLITVSRAILVLGFDEVKRIAVSCALIDNLLSGKARDRLNDVMAQSFHAAAQAEQLSRETGNGSPEEVFISSLLLRLGEMAFWCFGEDLADKLEDRISQGDISQPKAEHEVLGFRLQELTTALAREWHLGDMLEEAAHPVITSPVQVSFISECHKLAKTVGKDGWASEDVSRIVNRISLLSKKKVDQVRLVIENTAAQTVTTLKSFGLDTIAESIPIPGRKRPQEIQKIIKPSADEAIPADMPLEPDPILQLKIFRELAALTSKGGDINVVLEMVLEGLFRGIGMDRAIFALLSPDMGSLRAKYVLGRGRNELLEKFTFELNAEKPSFFSQLMKDNQSMWVPEEPNQEVRKLIGPSIRSVIGQGEFFVAPMRIRSRSIGAFYADRRTTSRPLDAESYESFKHFISQANASLVILSSR